MGALATDFGPQSLVLDHELPGLVHPHERKDRQPMFECVCLGEAFLPLLPCHLTLPVSLARSKEIKVQRGHMTDLAGK